MLDKYNYAKIIIAESVYFTIIGMNYLDKRDVTRADHGLACVSFERSLRVD